MSSDELVMRPLVNLNKPVGTNYLLLCKGDIVRVCTSGRKKERL